jgi:hypothetical protein
MSIQPYLESVGQLFGKNNIFRVPRYQRYYAWDADQISDFLNDLDLCVKSRSSGLGRREHFFGGLVTVRVSVPGTSRQNMEVIDGQQRLASFSMLVAQLRNAAVRLASQIDQGVVGNPHQFLVDFAASLTANYAVFNDKINLAVMQIDRLELSKPDLVFFKQLVAGANPIPTRTSHRRLRDAWDRIGTWLNALVASKASDTEKAQALSLVDTVVDSDWILIHMVTDSKAEAYRLFRVLNDRGTGLTEGELIRSQLLEALDGVATQVQLDSVEGIWDEILASDPGVVEQQLRTVYASMTGTRAGHASLLDDFLSKVFPELATLPLTAATTLSVATKVADLKRDVLLLNKLQGGEWPYASSAAVTAWDKSRLGLLIIELKHTNCLPLLLSATRLTEKKFSEIVQALERFMFRYKVICNAHIGAATNIYHAHAVAIRADPQNYSVASLCTALQTRLAASAPDDVFRANLRTLRYSRDRSNKPLKYLLITLESYLQWYLAGTVGLPLCLNKMIVFDPSATTIEHIYAQNNATPQPALDALVDTLGNLTLLGSTDNNAAGNLPFPAKRAIFANSSLRMNREIAINPQWTDVEVNARLTALEDAAVKIFQVA